ncbi:uncharacterized protein AKAW2_40997A [Aspergillus luchuensis]|uniref:Uncharacterized protein n=1 Tax=Aspergillus kawachii TaxID=1069201 RepID=A0A146FGT7_ASPKA|nr:uncharacterized protein AKAW2_40997A [Aspergillus luchuensis]BCR99315.1 hypothetical protein AKAW2_40997A [Aspergillus luchuensis]BCS11617.1 hypothetical protein ALUC_40957A [Aspergillus luchuensis]GAA86991.1 hypothetical protein AKAW_05105 [Aspergillus luchuensis IFO 4308]GAT25096.1 hypothetical protein RIB2604_01900470 [Aspergillus luchuensis]
MKFSLIWSLSLLLTVHAAVIPRPAESSMSLEAGVRAAEYEASGIHERSALPNDEGDDNKVDDEDNTVIGEGW